MRRIVSDKALDILFRTARDHHAWLDRPVSDTLLRALGELIRRGSMGGGADPVQIVFGRSREAKERLAAAAPEALRAGLLAAPVVAIIGRPRRGDRSPAASREVGLTAGCLVFAARALGLDCGPLWDIESPIADAAVFPDGAAAAAVLCAFGYGEDLPAGSEPAPSGAGEVCRIL